MIDPTSLARLAQIRQQDILDQAAYDRAPRVSLISGHGCSNRSMPSGSAVRAATPPISR